MTFSKTSHNLGVFAILLATAFFVCSSVSGEKLGRPRSAPLNQSGAAVILQADGGAPIPPPPPPPPPTRLSSASQA
jgi:drug/metabolite transporter (DMT)-like permease